MRCTGLDKTGSAYHTIVADGEGAQEERAGGTSKGMSSKGGGIWNGWGQGY